MDDDELAEAGLERLVAGDSRRHDERVASGVRLYWLAADARRVRDAHSRSVRAD